MGKVETENILPQHSRCSLFAVPTSNGKNGVTLGFTFAWLHVCLLDSASGSQLWGHRNKLKKLNPILTTQPRRGGFEHP